MCSNKHYNENKRQNNNTLKNQKTTQNIVRKKKENE